MLTSVGPLFEHELDDMTGGATMPAGRAGSGDVGDDPAEGAGSRIVACRSLDEPIGAAVGGGDVNQSFDEGRCQPSKN